MGTLFRINVNWYYLPLGVQIKRLKKKKPIKLFKKKKIIELNQILIYTFIYNNFNLLNNPSKDFNLPKKKLIMYYCQLIGVIYITSLYFYFLIT